MFLIHVISSSVFVIFFNDTATTEIYTLSLHDALPICHGDHRSAMIAGPSEHALLGRIAADRKSTRLNSSHYNISYAVFCLKKNKHDPGGARWVPAGAPRVEHRHHTMRA